MSDQHAPPQDPNLPQPNVVPAVAGASVPAEFASVPPATSLAQTSELSDGDWHRMHPLTPLLKGGVALLVIFGVIFANFRDALIGFFTRVFLPDDGFEVETGPDPVGWVFANNLVLVVLGGLLLLVVLLIAMFWVSWRFHQFRITEDGVEVRSGVVFRTQRRAPLDRVQGVNLTRPVVARLIGLAKLEVVVAGEGANVKLEYLTTRNAETVRSDILRLASGRRLLAQQGRAAANGGTRTQRAAATVSAGLDEIVQGVDHDIAPQSIVHIPTGRLIASQLLGGGTLGLVFGVAAIIVGAVIGTPWILFGMIPAVLGFGGYMVSQIIKSLRYSIAPTSDGIRVTFGLLTTVTETIPPGRIHAVEVTQSIFWRPFGWWLIKINRISGKKTSEGQTDPFAIILPVGTRADVDRVLALLLPPQAWGDLPSMHDDGLLGPREGDPYTNTPKRGWWVRPFSWRRNGYLLTSWGILQRRGRIWRKLAIFPYARTQSIAVHQGPLDRLARVAMLRVHTIQGNVLGILAGVDRGVVMDAFQQVAAASVEAAASDSSHRWAGDEPDDDAFGAEVGARFDAHPGSAGAVETSPTTADPHQTVPPRPPLPAGNTDAIVEEERRDGA